LVLGVETSRILRRWKVADRRSASRIPPGALDRIATVIALHSGQHRRKLMRL
jgi:hypothetical protein